MRTSRLNDDAYMARALELARQGEGLTRPNPPVGAVVVRDGRIVGEGFHPEAGEPHAEIFALRAAGARARGAMLYVTLEPCSTWGRTPPCTETVAVAGIRRVVIGARDPNPRHAGRGLRRLRARGIEVESGVRREEAETLIRPFAKWIMTGRPYWTLKLGMTLDGRIADSTGRSKWITGPAARAVVQALRRRADAIVVGVETARADDPSLMPRPARGRQPYRVVVDSRGRLPPVAQVLNDAAAARTIVAVTDRCDERAMRTFLRKGAQVAVLPAESGRVSLPNLAEYLGRLGLLHVVCEGGGELAAGLIAAELIDEYRIFVAPRLLGGAGRAAVGGRGWPLESAPHLQFAEFARVGDDLMITARSQTGKGS